MATKQNARDIPIANKRTIYYINDIVVDKNFRRKSIARKLYDYLLEKAIKEKVDAVELNVLSFNDSAIKFYESLGMTIKSIKYEKVLNNYKDLKPKNRV